MIGKGLEGGSPVIFMEGLRRIEWSLSAYCLFRPRFEPRSNLTMAGPHAVCVPLCLTGPAVETELSQEAALELRVEAGRLGGVFGVLCAGVCSRYLSCWSWPVLTCYPQLLSAQDEEKHSDSSLAWFRTV
jgi:hypothetical protein